MGSSVTRPIGARDRIPRSQPVARRSAEILCGFDATDPRDTMGGAGDDFFFRSRNFFCSRRPWANDLAFVGRPIRCRRNLILVLIKGFLP